MAALEFAIVAPVMLVFIFGVVDITRAMILYEEVYNAAHTIPVSASNLAYTDRPQEQTALTPEQAQWAMSAFWGEAPWIRSGLEGGSKAIVMTSVSFTLANSNCNPSNTTCAYNANTAWSVPYGSGQTTPPFNAFSSTTRPCGVLNQKTPATYTPGDLTSIPTLNVTNPDPVLVVDVYYQFTPLFFYFVTGPINFWASSFWPVRYIPPNSTASSQYTLFDPNNELNGAWKCSGYP